MPFANECIRLLQLCWKHFCSSNHHKHAAKPHCLWMMPWSLPCMPFGLRSQLHYRPILEDLFSLKTCFLIFLFLLIGRQFFQGESNWSMMPCFVPTKSLSTFTIKLEKILKFDKTLYGKLKPKITGPFDILRVQSNGTAIISLQPGITKCVNICRTLPYKEPTPL